MILVTGATGKIGGNLARILIQRGVAVRATTRDPDNADLPREVDVRRADLTDAASVAAAAEGCDAALLVMPFVADANTDQTGPEVIRALGARVDRVVHVSSEHVPRAPGSFWDRLENDVCASVGRWTMLRPVGFAGNTLGWADQIRRGDTVRWIFGDVARPLIDEYDIADVARVALTEEGHSGQTYVLSGPAMISNREQVHEIGRAIGRDLHWQELDRDTAVEEIGAGLGNPGGVTAMIEAWGAFAQDPEPITDTVARLTGRPARTFAQWTAANAERFR